MRSGLHHATISLQGWEFDEAEIQLVAYACCSTS